jgi:hypothetical protein
MGDEVKEGRRRACPDREVGRLGDEVRIQGDEPILNIRSGGREIRCG